MTVDALSFGIDVSSIVRDSAAAADPFFESAASSTSLATIMRSTLVVREPMEPISFPFGVENLEV